MFELTPQMIGVIAGSIVFLITVFVTFLLLIFGGSFQRMREQANTYSHSGRNALEKILKPRPELYDELLEAARTLPITPTPPGELCGQIVILRALGKGAHDTEELWQACNGLPTLGLAYNPEIELWNLTPHGPFHDAEKLACSPLMQPLSDGFRFKVVDRETAKTIGMASILANKPSYLRAEIGDIWLNPNYKESRALYDVIFLLLNYLFGLGYRRVESRADAGDMRARAYLPAAGFNLEGVLRKHMIVKGSNRDTAMFAMVNSDWRDKAKEALRKLLEPEDGTKLRRAKAKAKAAVMAAKTKAATENSTTGRDPATAASKAGATGAEADHYKSKSKDA